MHKGQKLVPLVGDGSPEHTEITPLAMALATLGIPVDPDVGAQHFRQKTGDSVRETTVWILGTRSACGKYQTATLARKWDDLEWREQNFTHPLALMRLAYDLRRQLIGRVKERPAVPECQPGENGPCSSSDPQIVASLNALGIGFAESRPLVSLHGRPHDYLFQLAPSSVDGRWKTDAMLALWHDREWRELNREHPLTYLHTFWKNYQAGLAHIAKIGPLAVYRNGRRTGIISRDTTPEDRKKILAGLGQ